MPRIRSIKPEFPQSESMGRVSREARLLFIMLWTICDDAGRTRAASRMLASLLYPYDDDAPKRMDGWISELEREKCVVRYQADGSTYLEVCNWLNHQKIDKPSKSKIPPFANVREDSPNPREDSSGDLRIEGSKDQGLDQGEGGASAPTAPKRATRLPDGWKPDADLIAYAEAELPNVDAAKLAEEFTDYWRAAAGEKARKVDWAATWRTWVRRSANRYPTRKQALVREKQIRFDANGREIT